MRQPFDQQNQQVPLLRQKHQYQESAAPDSHRWVQGVIVQYQPRVEPPEDELKQCRHRARPSAHEVLEVRSCQTLTSLD